MEEERLIYVKNFSSQQTNTLSQLLEEEGNKNTRLAHEMAKKTLLLENDFVCERIQITCVWGFCESLVSDLDTKYDNYLHMLA